MIDFKNEGKEGLQQIIRAARGRLGDIEHKERVADLRKKVGQCFKYRNNYSCPAKPSDYWWMYIKIIEARDGEAICFEFQIDRYGHLTVKPRANNYSIEPSADRGYTPISNADFDKAWKAAQKKVAGWKP